MATFTCWCCHTIRENDAPENAGHVLWDSQTGFYEKVAADLLSYVRAQSVGDAREWIRNYFEDSLAPYDMSPGEVAEGIVYRTSDNSISGIYRCPNCRRIHVHVTGTDNQWESFVPEGRVSGK
jgi:hypothetical protein